MKAEGRAHAKALGREAALSGQWLELERRGGSVQCGGVGRALQATAGACCHPMPKRKPHKASEGLVGSGLHLTDCPSRSLGRAGQSRGGGSTRRQLGD